MDKGLALISASLLASAGMANDMPHARIECGTQFAKAMPAIEGGQRVLYMEASSEAPDLQNERILAKALEESKDYFLKFGRIDLDHATVWKMIRETKLDPENPYAREIGRPLDVKITRKDGDVPRVWVKCAIFKSSNKENQFTKAADYFWDTLETNPPVQWFPSVSGNLLLAEPEKGADGKSRRVIKALRWHSIGLSRTPVNTDLGPVSSVPLEVFCKALSEGSDISKALAAMGSAPAIADPDVALQRIGIAVPSCQGGSVAPGILTEDKARIIHDAILTAKPPFALQEWLHELTEAGITPAEGMAYLLAVVDVNHQPAILFPR